MFNWNKFPYTNFHELNLDWFIKKFQEIFDQWATLYQTMLEWKADTDQDLANWKRDTLAALDQWEDDLIDALNLWKQATGQDITDWEDGVIRDLNSWKSRFEDDYEALATRVQAIVSDVEDMVENLADPFSTSTAYVIGDYVVQNGILYRFTADHPAGAWTGADAQQVTAMREIDDLAADDWYNQVFTNAGTIHVTWNMLENGIWYLGNKQANANRGRLKRLIPVKKGMRLTNDIGEFDIYWGVAATRPWSSYTQGGGWVTTQGTFSTKINQDGWLVIMIKNHGADTTPVDCTAFNQNEHIDTVIGDETLSYYSIPSGTSFGIKDLPLNSYTYTSLTERTFTDKPSDLPTSEYVYIRKEVMNSAENLHLVTVRDSVAQTTYQATFRSSDNTLWPWRRILTDIDEDRLEIPPRNIRTCRIFKRVLCVGDSYTEGWIDLSAGGSTDPERGAYRDYSWPTFMETITGNEWVNCGVSGATTLSWLTSAGGLAAAQTAGKVQAYIVQLMINDASSVPVGTSADIGTDSPTTFYGAYAKIIRELHTISPDAFIFVCTCPYLSDKTAYQEAVRYIANVYASTYHVHLLDFKADQVLFREPSMADDLINNHYTGIGYEQMAEGYAYYISEYINANISAFQNVHQIEYD